MAPSCTSTALLLQRTFPPKSGLILFHFLPLDPASHNLEILFSSHIQSSLSAKTYWLLTTLATGKRQLCPSRNNGAFLETKKIGAKGPRCPSPTSYKPRPTGVRTTSGPRTGMPSPSLLILRNDVDLGPFAQTPQYVPVDHAGQPPASGPPPLAPAPPAERHDFEAFARHLQDAAMLIYRQTSKSPYANVTVLMLRWEEDTSVEPDLLALEKVFRERYNYHTDKWQIPTCPNPSIKLGVQMASFLEHARPDHLLIIYYAGHGYVDPDNQLYWAW